MDDYGTLLAETSEYWDAGDSFYCSMSAYGGFYHRHTINPFITWIQDV